MIAAGYLDGTDAHEPAHRSGIQDGARTAAVGSGPVFTVDHLAGWRTYRIYARCCASAVLWSISIAGSFRQVPRRITLDID